MPGQKFNIMELTITLMLFATTFYGQGIIIDHTAIERFDQIPAEWIITAKDSVKVHFQHNSHGSQLSIGAKRLETELYQAIFAEGSLPHVVSALNIYEDTFPAESYHWGGDPPNVPALNRNPSINVSIWAWCTELNRKSNVTRYFEGMQALEEKYPHVKFIYMTGNAQAWHGHHTYNRDRQGYNRYLRNEEIRQYCQEQDKILFDFADIDAWYNGDRDTSSYNGFSFPREHDRYNIDQAGHTSFENCENKARAFWYMMAVLAGWDDGAVKPVKLIKFEGRVNNNTIRLNWETASEQINFGFELHRSDGDSMNFKKIAFINGNGTTAGTRKYYYFDRNLPAGIYFYRLTAIDTDGCLHYFRPIRIFVLTPDLTWLNQNFPNPFNVSTTITYTLANSDDVKLNIYDITGKMVHQLVNKYQQPGMYRINWKVNNLPSGKYFYKLDIGDFSMTKSMLYIK